MVQTLYLSQQLVDDGHLQICGPILWTKEKCYVLSVSHATDLFFFFSTHILTDT